jgi:hypothetical protein
MTPAAEANKTAIEEKSRDASVRHSIHRFEVVLGIKLT